MLSYVASDNIHHRDNITAKKNGSGVMTYVKNMTDNSGKMDCASAFINKIQLTHYEAPSLWM